MVIWARREPRPVCRLRYTVCMFTFEVLVCIQYYRVHRCALERGYRKGCGVGLSTLSA